MSGYAQILNRVDYPLEDILSIETIRVHTKTEDIPLVTDDQLAMYRQAAFEHAELYTGRIISGYATIAEPANTGKGRHGFRESYRLKLTYLPMEPYVDLRKDGGGKSVRAPVKLNSRKINVPMIQQALDMASCCRRDGDFNGNNFEYKVVYRTGYPNKELIPATLLYGCLKFITWATHNPGDELLTVRNRLGTTETGLIGTNNGAWASGAIEAWRLYKVD